MTNHPNRKRNYVYEIVCDDHRGWGAIPEGLWSPDYVEREDRLFATAAEARAVVADFLADSSVWTTDEAGYDPPRFSVEKVAVYEFLWGDHDQSVIDRVIDLRGGPIKFASMPESVARFLLAKFGGHERDWSRASASMRGASSATHTAALVAGVWNSRVTELHDMLRERGITV
jgi:hypothetical protein